MSYKDFKKGDRIKLVKLPERDEHYYEKYNIEIGDIRYFGYIISNIYYHIMDKEGNEIGGSIVGREDEWVLCNNDYGCKNACSPCVEKCAFFEEV